MGKWSDRFKEVVDSTKANEKLYYERRDEVSFGARVTNLGWMASSVAYQMGGIVELFRGQWSTGVGMFAVAMATRYGHSNEVAAIAEELRSLSEINAGEIPPGE